MARACRSSSSCPPWRWVALIAAGSPVAAVVFAVVVVVNAALLTALSQWDA
jgi:hypothetical protein